MTVEAVCLARNVQFVPSVRGEPPRIAAFFLPELGIVRQGRHRRPWYNGSVGGTATLPEAKKFFCFRRLARTLFCTETYQK